MSLHTVKVRVNAGGYGTVHLDGQELNGVSGIAVEIHAGRPTMVHLALMCDVEIDATVDRETLELTRGHLPA